jgi:hypothetical protein
MATMDEKLRKKKRVFFVLFLFAHVQLSASKYASKRCNLATFVIPVNADRWCRSKRRCLAFERDNQATLAQKPKKNPHKSDSTYGYETQAETTNTSKFIET